MTLQEAYNLVGKYFFNGEHEEDEAAGVEALKLLSAKSELRFI